MPRKITNIVILFIVIHLILKSKSVKLVSLFQERSRTRTYLGLNTFAQREVNINKATIINNWSKNPFPADNFSKESLQ